MKCSDCRILRDLPTIGSGMLHQHLGLYPDQRAQRVRMFRITEVDCERIRHIGPDLKSSLPDIVDAFYDHLESFPEFLSFITALGYSTEQLRQTNIEYFDHLLKAEFDLEYFESRLKIGFIHAKIGVPHDWFMGAFTGYYDAILNAAEKWPNWCHNDLMIHLVSLHKAMTLDQNLITEAYLEAKEQAYVHRICQMRNLLDSEASGD